MSLHQKLKEAREAKGVSLELLSQNTRIRQECLSAMEEGDFSFLPCPYVRMFVKAYAEEVGLDPDEALAEFDRAFPPEPPSRVEPPPKESRAFPWRYGIGIGILALVGLALLLSRKPSPPPIHKSPSAAHDTLARREQPLPSRDTLLVLSGYAQEKTWVAVASDGKLFYVGFMPMDREVQWEAKERLELLLGKPHGVRFVLDGRPVDDSPWDREPVRVRCTRKEVEVVRRSFPWEASLPRPGER